MCGDANVSTTEQMTHKQNTFADFSDKQQAVGCLQDVATSRLTVSQ